MGVRARGELIAGFIQIGFYFCNVVVSLPALLGIGVFTGLEFPKVEERRCFLAVSRIVVLATRGGRYPGVSMGLALEAVGCTTDSDRTRTPFSD